MPGTREQVLTALLELIKLSGDFVVASRRNREPAAVTPALSPSLFLVTAEEEYKASPTQPRRLTLTAKAMIYSDVGENANLVPEAFINNAMDALDALMKPDPLTGRFTLGGLVYSCQISGSAKRSAGEVTGKSLAIVPFEILFP